MFIKNIALYTRTPKHVITHDDGSRESDFQPSSFWITNPTNTWFGNVAGGSEDSGFWWEMIKRGPRANVAPYDQIDPEHDDLNQFEYNVVHSCGKKYRELRVSVSYDGVCMRMCMCMCGVHDLVYLPVPPSRSSPPTLAVVGDIHFHLLLTPSIDWLSPSCSCLQGAFRMYPNGYKPTNWQTLSNNKGYRNRSGRGLFIHRCVRLIFENDIYADNEIDVDIDRADALEIRNFTIIGESDSFKSLRERQSSLHVCTLTSPKRKIGLGVHSWKRDFIGNALVEDVRFQNFDDVACEHTHAIDMDPQSLTDDVFDLLTSFKDIDFGGLTDVNKLNFCRAKETGLTNGYYTDFDGSIRPDGEPVPDGIATALMTPDMLTFVDNNKCKDMPDYCFAYCTDTCLRSFRFLVDYREINADYKLKVCDRFDLDNCMLFPTGRRASRPSMRTPYSTLAHLPPGSYVGVFLDPSGDEVTMPILRTKNETQCPDGFDGVSLDIVDSMANVQPINPMSPAPSDVPSNTPSASPTTMPSASPSGSPTIDVSDMPTGAPVVDIPMWISNVRLFNTATRKSIRILDQNSFIDYATDPTSMTIRAKVGGEGIQKVAFILDGQTIGEDSSSPYYINDSVRNPYEGLNHLSLGIHTLEVTVYGASGVTLTEAVNFIVKNGEV